jgi:hypothetical protein
MLLVMAYKALSNSVSTFIAAATSGPAACGIAVRSFCTAGSRRQGTSTCVAWQACLSSLCKVYGDNYAICQLADQLHEAGRFGGISVASALVGTVLPNERMSIARAVDVALPPVLLQIREQKEA